MVGRPIIILSLACCGTALLVFSRRGARDARGKRGWSTPARVGGVALLVAALVPIALAVWVLVLARSPKDPAKLKAEALDLIEAAGGLERVEREAAEVFAARFAVTGDAPGKLLDDPMPLPAGKYPALSMLAQRGLYRGIDLRPPPCVSYNFHAHLKGFFLDIYYTNWPSRHEKNANEIELSPGRVYLAF